MQEINDSMEDISSERNVKRAIALLFIGILAIAISYALYPYIGAFFAAVIIYVITNPVHSYITKKSKLDIRITSIIIIFLSLITIIIPLYYIIILLSEQAKQLMDIARLNWDILEENIQLIDEIAPALNIELKMAEFADIIEEFITGFIFGTIQNLGNQLIGLAIMVFLLYYLLSTDNKKIEEMAFNILPFSNKNKIYLINEMRDVVYSTIIGILFIALFQGGVLTITFLLLGIEGALLWGFITLILSIIPFIGPPLVWAPATIYKIIEGDLFAGTIIFVAGMFISNFDYVLRPYIQEKFAAIHPLISLLGLFIGIYLFGAIGLVVGPVLLSCFLLMLKMFNQEYIEG
jgi:predicted PurR-regulated permease PerM